jgi:DNA-binding winged helix-turn-helix (wHTH) protein
LLPVERQLLVDGNPVVLGARALDVLLALIERRERLVTKGELLDVVWPGLAVEQRHVQHIHGLVEPWIDPELLAKAGMLG